MEINEYSQQKKQKEFEQDLSFQEWLNYFQKEPTDKELNAMEKDISRSHRKYQIPFNNINYQPLQGA